MSDNVYKVNSPQWFEKENEKLKAENLTLAKINKTMSDEVCEYVKENQQLRELVNEAISLLELNIKAHQNNGYNCGFERDEEWLEKAKEGFMSEWRCNVCGRSNDHTIKDCITKLEAEIERLNRYDLDLQIFAKENKELRELVKDFIDLDGITFPARKKELMDKAKEILGE